MLGMRLNEAKCIHLLREAADLGCPVAQYKLGNYYDNGEMGLKENVEEARKYDEKAAEGGNVVARYSLGITDGRNGNDVAAMRHFRLSASGRYRKPMNALIVCFEVGLLHHRDLFETIRVFYRSRGEMRSDDRDKYIEFMKETGRYEADYDS